MAADANITAALLATLDIPPDAARLLFRTLNTRRRLLRQSAFASDYVGLDSSAARWLAEERPVVRLVGIDYLSIGAMYDIVEAHKTLFRTVRGGGSLARRWLSKAGRGTGWLDGPLGGVKGCWSQHSTGANHTARPPAPHPRPPITPVLRSPPSSDHPRPPITPVLRSPPSPRAPSSWRA